MFNQLIEKLHNDPYLTLETTPGHQATFQPIIDTISTLGLDKKVDGFSTTDNPLAKLKYNAILAALKLQTAFNKPALATMSMRDRNKIALQSDLLGANEFDVRAFLALTGDSAQISDQPNSKGVFEADSGLLLEIIKCFNAGIDYAGKPFKVAPQTIYPFTVVNSFAKQEKTLVKKMSKKIANATQGIITQPIYGIDNAKTMLRLHNEASKLAHSEGSTLIFGVFPITKLRTAQFLTSHVPGIHVPTQWVDALYKASKVSVEEEYKVGFEMSYTLLKELQKIHPKVHLMTANQFSLANDLLH